MTMILETYIVTVGHDAGKIRFTVVSMSGEQGAIDMIMSAEHCPRCAILKTKKIKTQVV